MAHRIAMIASDLDGTLLLDGAQSLNAEVFPLIRRLQERGIVFYAASGRQYASLRRLFAPVADEIGYICENGCLSFFKGRMISQATMPNELARELICAMQEIEGVEVLVSGVETCYIQPRDERFAALLRDEVGNDVTVVPDLLNLPEPYMKISFYEEGGLRDTRPWRERFGAECTVQTGGHEWLDIMPKGVNKWTAIEANLMRLGIAADDVLAFGDNENDRQMLCRVGCPITMDKARADVRILGRYHTESVESSLRNILDGEGYDW